MHFETYARKKELQEFNDKLAHYAKDYAQLKILGEVDGHPIHHLVLNPKGGRTVCFVAGIHGDEIGGPYGVLAFMKQGMRIPENVRVEIVPLANPTGFIKRSRENNEGIDINRKFYEEDLIEECKYVWRVVNKPEMECLHTLHEDLDLKTFYLYYTHHTSLAKGLRDEVAKKYFTIFGSEERKPKPGEDHELYSDKVYEGLIPLPHTKRNTVEDRILEQCGVPYITTETPGKATLRSRALCNRDIMKYVIHSFAEQ